VSLRDQILAAQDLRHEDVEVPEWGVKVRVRTLRGEEIDAWVQAHIDEKGAPRDGPDRMMRIFVACVVDPETEAPLFTLADIPALQKKCATAVSGLAGIALTLNGGKAKN
jgi:hypothetical protein